MTATNLPGDAAAILALTHEIGPEIVADTASDDLAVIQQARTIANFVEGHAAGKLGLTVGLEALALSGKAVVSAIQAREDSMQARLAFFRAAKAGAPEIAFGPWCPCDPPHGQPNGASEGVVKAALSA